MLSKFKKTLKKNYFPATSKYLFLAGFLILCYLYQYNDIINLTPRSIHQFRQCDCLSLTQNYYNDGNSFCKPAMHNQVSQDGESGRSAGEFPLLYYSVAKLWSLFGQHIFIYRLLVILLSFAGLYAFFKASEGITDNSYTALFLSFLFFTSPVVAFYSSAFLTNMPAFAIALTGWYFIYRYFRNSRTIWFAAAVILFTLAGLLKVSSAISFVLLACLLIGDYTAWLRLHKNHRLFYKPLLYFIFIIAGFAAIFAWYAYARDYNKMYGGAYTFNDLWPIWRMSAEEIAIVWKGFTESMFRQILSPVLWITTALMFVVVLILFKLKVLPRYYFIVLMIMISGVILYTLMWFNAIGNHDYYLIDWLMPVLAIWLLFFKGLERLSPSFVNNVIIRLAMIVLLGYNILYCSNNMRMRYWIDPVKPELYAPELEIGVWAWMHYDYNRRFNAMNKIEPYLELLDIKPEDKIISLPDESINVSLVLLQHKGWNSYGFGHLSTKERISHMISCGARYLFVNDSSAYADTAIYSFLKKPMGNFENIQIYDLRSFQ